MLIHSTEVAQSVGRSIGNETTDFPLSKDLLTSCDIHSTAEQLIECFRVRFSNWSFGWSLLMPGGFQSIFRIGW